ncbi:MAG: hypothetical protein MUE85_14915, partial [Microscillaceae bacterium]|nr:hypothetical protein [Microscillaceae bacterium]
EESETLDNQRFRFFALLRMTKKFFSFLKSGEEPHLITTHPDLPAPFVFLPKGERNTGSRF